MKLSKGELSSRNESSSFKFNKGFDSNTLIAFIALFVAAFSTYKSCSQEEQIAKINFQRMAEDYRPQLIASTPFNMSAHLKVDSVALATSLNSFKKGTVIKMLDLPLSEFKFNFSLWLRNRGNTQANLLGWLIMDSVYQGPLLKNKIKENISPLKINTNIEPRLVTINKDDSVSIEFKIPIRNILQNTIIIHIYILYENESKFLYSSYTWLEFQSDPSIALIRNPDSKVIGFHTELELNQNDFIYKSKHTIPSIVEPQDTAAIYNFLRNAYKSSLIPSNQLPDFPIKNESFPNSKINN